MADKYTPVQELGSGAFGKAWLMSGKPSGKQVVAKVIKMSSLSEKELDQCISEVAILSACRHVNIVQYIEAFTSRRSLHIVMEYAKEGDLHQRISNQHGTPLEREVALDWFVQIVSALNYIHSRSILHRDLKPQNVFIMENGTLKLGDFGIARVLCGQKDFASTMIGTPYYLSPEICEGKQYNYSSDMWAAGCLLYQMCHLAVPFEAPTLAELYQKIVQACYKPVPRAYGETVSFLVSKLLTLNPGDRLLARKILRLKELSHFVTLNTQRQDGYKRSRSRSRSQCRARVAESEHDIVCPEKRDEEYYSDVKSDPPEPTVTDSATVCPRAARQPVKDVLFISLQTNISENSFALGHEMDSNKSATNGVNSNNVDNAGTSASRQNQQQDNKSLLDGCGSGEHSREELTVKPTGGAFHNRCLADNNPDQPAVTKSRTYTVKTRIARRLSEASPKLSNTLARQRSSISDVDTLQLKPEERDVCDDVFSPTVKASGASMTYVVKRKDSIDSNNNAGQVVVQDIKATIIEALSVSGFNREMARGILQHGLESRLGQDRARALVDKMRRTVLENGQSYQTLQTMLTVEELELIPLAAMLCW